MHSRTVLIYGAYGYTGQLITNTFINRGFKPIIAGRDAQKLTIQAKATGLESRLFAIDDAPGLKEALEGCFCLVNCAGPFSETFRPLIDACLETQTHYLDITGEYQVIEALSMRDKDARAAGIMVLPGAGFDVVPSDCLASYLKNKLPDASELTLAITSVQDGYHPGSGLSRGTLKTALMGFSGETMIRDKGVITARGKPRTEMFTFLNQRKRLCQSVAWGDIASAWWSTKIPHIETWMSFPKRLMTVMQILYPIRRLINWRPLKEALLKKINQSPEGPTPEARAQSHAEILGIVRNSTGTDVRAVLTTPNGYTLTAEAVVTIVEKMLNGNVSCGFQTPATAYGYGLALEIDGVRIDDI